MSRTRASRRRILAAALLAVTSYAMALPVFAQSDSTVELIVPRGRPLRVALATDTTVKKVGQMVTGTLVEPIYAYDRIVLPAGTKVEGRITRLDNPSRLNRAQRWAAVISRRITSSSSGSKR